VNPRPTVFVVEDEEPVRSSLARLLSAIGYPNRTFDSAEAFLESDAGDRDGCLLVDIRMPGMSGLDLLEELERRGISLPAIVMTGHIDERSLQRLGTLHTIGFLEKPFSVRELKAVLERWRPLVDGPPPP